MELKAHHALTLATRAVPIIKHLTATDKTMTIKEFGQAIGIVKAAWKPWHREQIHVVLAIVQATFNRLNEAQLECDRVKQPSKQGDGHQYGHWRPEQF